jgi:hypothetical protein
MAKTQNLSLNPTKISGTCGRLMCCLKYEQEAYEDLIRNSPKVDSFVDTPEGRGTVVELDLLRSRVKVRMEDSPETVSLFNNADVAVFRNGKAKKNDPPVPTDWAPISGSGKRVRRDPEEEQLKLDPIRFRYSTEAVVEEKVEAPAPVKDEEKPRRSRRPNKPNKPQQEQPAEKPKKEQPKKEQPKKAPEPKKEAPQPKDEQGKTADQPKKPYRRRPPFRHKKPKPSGENNA